MGTEPRNDRNGRSIPRRTESGDGAHIKDAEAVELVLLAMFEAVEKAIAVGCFDGDPARVSRIGGLQPAVRSTSR